MAAVTICSDFGTPKNKDDLNQILNDYIVELTNRFKGLNLIKYLKNYGQRFITLYRR